MDEQDKEVVRVKSVLKTPYRPGIAEIMVILGGLSIVGGAILCVLLWPSTDYVWEATAYVPALTWLFSSIISGVLFFACAAALTYLHATREYVKAIALRLYDDVTENKEDKEQRQLEQSEMEEWRRQTKLHPRKLDK